MEPGESTASRLSREWVTIGGAPVPAGWHEQAALRGRRTVAEVFGSITGAAADEVLVCLVALLQRGDRLAGRVVLQALLGKLVLFAAADRHHCLDDYVAHLWLTMSGYPVGVRLRRVAANLALDTRKAVWADRSRDLVCPPEVVVALTGAPVPPGVSGAQVLARAERLGLLDSRAAAILRSVYLEGMPGRVAAVRHATSETAIRWRCSKSVRALAAHATELLAA